MGGGQSNISSIGIAKQQGYRIINVKPNSPLSGNVDVFFDFIIDAIPSKQPEKTVKNILGKLTDEQNPAPKVSKKLSQIFMQNVGQMVNLKIVSTKYRNVRNVEVIPNKNWGQSEDLIGIQTRIQRYDEAFETYFPFSNIRPNSPINKAKIQQNQYLIGFVEFKYNSINELLENIYDRFFDKNVIDKNVHVAVYNLLKDQLRIVPVLLTRGWGENGLLGCEFLQGVLNKFPKNLLQMRTQLDQKRKKVEENAKLKKQLSECNGASVQLIETLKNQRNKKKKDIKHFKNILLIQAPPQRIPSESQRKQQHIPQKQSKSNNPEPLNSRVEYVPLQKYKQLESRVATLEVIIQSLRQYVEENVNNQEQILQKQ